MNVPTVGRQLRSKVTDAGTIELSLVDVPVGAPAPGEIVVRIEAAPINPSDISLLLGAADPATFARHGDALIAPIPPERIATMSARAGESIAVGNEGAGTVVAAGSGAEALIGRKVAIIGGPTYAEYCTVKGHEALVLPEGVAATEGASVTVNPMTALSMVETMRAEGHSALVHTAAASNLGQMLVRICLADGVPLVNVVRSDDQVQLLTAIGATHVIDSTKENFTGRLIDALTETGATLAFDAVGGGSLAGRILGAMDIASSRGKTYSRYGSTIHKQIYIYGRLDLSPTELPPNAGMTWSVGGYLLTPFLMKAEPHRIAALRKRVMDELTTTFASHYALSIGLDEILDPQTVQGCARRSTGGKFLLNPSKASYAGWPGEATRSGSQTSVSSALDR